MDPEKPGKKPSSPWLFPSLMDTWPKKIAGIVLALIVLMLLICYGLGTYGPASITASELREAREPVRPLGELRRRGKIMGWFSRVRGGRR